MAKSHAFTVDGREMTTDAGDLHKSLALLAILMTTVDQRLLRTGCAGPVRVLNV